MDDARIFQTTSVFAIWDGLPMIARLTVDAITILLVVLRSEFVMSATITPRERNVTNV